MRRPVVVGAEVQTRGGRSALIVPVPRAGHGRGALDLKGLLDRPTVRDRVVEVEDDRHPHPVGLVVALNGPGDERLLRSERVKRGGLRDRRAGGSGARCADRVVLADAKRPGAVPGSAGVVHRPRNCLVASAGAYPGERAAGRGNPQPTVRPAVRATGRRDRDSHLAGGRRCTRLAPRLRACITTGRWRGTRPRAPSTADEHQRSEDAHDGSHDNTRPIPTGHP